MNFKKPGRGIAVSAARTALLYSAAGFICGNIPKLRALLGKQVLSYGFAGLFVLIVALVAFAFIRALLQWRALPPPPAQVSAAREANSLAWFGLFCGLSLLWVLWNIVGAAILSKMTTKLFLDRYAHAGFYSFLALLGAASGLVATPLILVLIQRSTHPQTQAWAKRGLAALAGGTCGFLLAGAFWNAIGTIVLSRATEEVRQAGYSVAPLPAWPILADKDNAAFYYGRLNTIASLANTQEKVAEQSFLKGFLAQAAQGTAASSDYKRARRIVARHAEGLHLWKLGAAQNRANWDIDWGHDPVSGKPLTEYSGMVVISRVLAARAILQARNGQGREAVESVRLGLAAARSLENRGAMIAVMVQSMLDDTALEAGRAVLRQAHPDLAQELWTPLLDPGPIMKSFRTALGYSHFADSLAAAEITWWDMAFGEYRGLGVDKSMFGIELPRAGPRRTMRLALLAAYWPFMKLDIASGLRGRLKIDLALENLVFLRQDDYNKVVERVVFSEWTLAAINMGNYWRAHAKFLVTATNLRLARAALAANLFREKQGRWPRSVDELAHFSKEQFADPFSAGSLKLTDGRDGPVLYSVGPDITDDGGAAYDEGKMTGDLRWEL